VSPPPWCLSGLDRAGRQKRFEVLADWVGWLTERYGLHRSIPSCWWRHPAMVEELNALELAWSAAYESEGADKEAPLRWHEELAKARQRLVQWDRQGCAGGTHRDQRGPRRPGQDAEPQSCAQRDAEQRQLKASLRPGDSAFGFPPSPSRREDTAAPVEDDEAISNADELFTKLILLGGDTTSEPEHPGEDGEEGRPRC
jgi:hypothetical protein